MSERPRLIEHKGLRLALWIVAVSMLTIGLSSLALSAWNYVATFRPVVWLTSSGGCITQGKDSGNVNLRSECDTKDCLNDPSTIYSEVESGTPVTVRKVPQINVRNTTWVPIEFDGRDLWISSKVIACN